MKKSSQRAQCPLPSYMLREFGDGLVANHRLSELSLFSDQGLVDLIERHDDDDRLVTTMGARPEHPSEYQTGCWEDTPDCLELMRTGRLELTLRGLPKHAATRRVAERLVQEYMDQFPDDRAADWDARLTVASPESLTYFTYSTDHTLWLQVRGKRTIWVYPSEPPFYSERAIEDISLGERVDSLYYEPAFDEFARCLEVEPGQFVSLPPRTPFRTVCGSKLNVAMTVAIATSRSRRADRNTVVRGWMRRKLPIDIDRGIGSVVTRAVATASRLFKTPAGHRQPRDRQTDVSFRVDADAPNGVGPMHRSTPVPLPAVPVTLHTNPTPVSAMET